MVDGQDTEAEEYTNVLFSGDLPAAVSTVAKELDKVEKASLKQQNTVYFDPYGTYGWTIRPQTYFL